MRDSEALLRMIFQAARAAGVSRDALAAELNCPPAFLDNPEGRHPHELQAYFWAALEKLTGDVEKDMDVIREFYADKLGKYPEKFGPVVLREELAAEAATPEPAPDPAASGDR